MLENDKEIEEVNEWTYKINGELEKDGQPLENLQKLLKKSCKRQTNQKRSEKKKVQKNRENKRDIEINQR